MACPAWPGCFPGQLTPDGLHSAIEFTHRVVAFGSLVTLAAAGWQGRRLADPRLRWFPVAALVAAIASGVFGMMIVLFSLPLALGVLDVAAAQVALCLITWAAVRLDVPAASPGTTGGLARWGWATAGVVIAMHLLGIVVAGEGSLVRCLGWPVWRIVATDGAPELQWLRLGVGVVAALMLVRLVLLAWRRLALRRLAVALAVVWVTELALGQLIVGQFADGQPRHLGLAAAYSMLAGLIVWLIALVASAAETLGSHRV
jgi:cytochrome c oxidase assembly protein subunit 15